MGAQAEPGAALWRPLGTGAHVVGPGGRPVRRAPVPRRRAWIGARAPTPGMVLLSDNYTARAVKFAPCHRIVASRLPTIHLFERVADPADWEALYRLESMTNPRIRNEVGELSLVPLADRVSGPNASVVMAPFTHLSPQ